MDETKIIYHIDDEETPYLIKLPIPSDRVTLGDFKNALNRPNYKFFFKSMDDDFGVVKEEIIEDEAHLPCFNGRVVSWLVPAENSASDTQSQCTESNAGDLVAHLPGGERVGGIGDSRPPSFHANASIGGVGSRDDNCDTCTETDSVLSSRRDRRPPRPHPKDRLDGPRVNGHNKLDRLRDPRHYDTASSVLTSELESTSFFDSEDDMSSRFSSTTETTTRSSKYGRHRRRKRRHRLPPISRASSFSSITDSTMSLNIITVTVNLDTVNFLGISIVGQSNKGGDGGIYVGSIMKGGAIAQDGRIEPGDMILEVNGISFENMSNDDAVRTLREAVQKPGPITLVVAKCWDPTPKGYFTIPRQEPVRPIDPSAWVAHTTAMRAGIGGMSAGMSLPGSGPLAPSMTNMTSNSSVTSSLPDSERFEDPQMHLSIEMDMLTIVKAMAAPESGLEIRDRMWLKITIPNAFIGSDLVDWLFTHVEGFADRRDARKYACNLLKANLIRHTVNKITFSEQCYYIFGDLCGGMSALNLDDGLDSVSEADRDTLAPLPPPAWNNQYMAYSNSNFSSYASMPYQYGGTETVSYGTLPPREGSAGSVHSGSAVTAMNTCACIMTHTYKHIRKLWTNKEKEEEAAQRALLRTSPCNHDNSSHGSNGSGNCPLHDNKSGSSSGGSGGKLERAHRDHNSHHSNKRSSRRSHGSRHSNASRSTASEGSSASGSSTGKKKDKNKDLADSGTDTDAQSVVSVQHRTPSGSSDPSAPLGMTPLQGGPVVVPLLPPPPATQSESSFRMAMGNP